MNDMARTIEAKSDQLNADDLIAGPVTIKISRVDVVAGEQPVIIHYEGDRGKPYKPGKSMCRVLVAAWGDKSKEYAGKSLRLYRDDTVTFGGIAVGGIRISHMSNLKAPLTIALSVKRGSKKLFTVNPLKDEPKVEHKEATPEQKLAAANKKADAIIAQFAQAKTAADIEAILTAESEAIDRLNSSYPDIADRVDSQRQFVLGAFNLTA